MVAIIFTFFPRQRAEYHMLYFKRGEWILCVYRRRRDARLNSDIHMHPYFTRNPSTLSPIPVLIPLLKRSVRNLIIITRRQSRRQSAFRHTTEKRVLFTYRFGDGCVVETFGKVIFTKKEIVREEKAFETTVWENKKKTFW